MKRRFHKIANFFAFNLLFFALYLNFIHQDKSSVPVVTSNTKQQATAAFSGTVIVEPGNEVEPKAVNTVTVDQQPSQNDNNVALKLSIN